MEKEFIITEVKDADDLLKQLNKAFEKMNEVLMGLNNRLQLLEGVIEEAQKVDKGNWWSSL